MSEFPALFIHDLCLEMLIIQQEEEVVDIPEGQFTDLVRIGWGGQARVYR